jgi:hypothetical protein
MPQDDRLKHEQLQLRQGEQRPSEVRPLALRGGPTQELTGHTHHLQNQGERGQHREKYREQ